MEGGTLSTGFADASFHNESIPYPEWLCPIRDLLKDGWNVYNSQNLLFILRSHHERVAGERK